jgi:hypothetical protein
MTITISDTLLILATLLSPLIAVQVQKWVEGATVRRNAQRQVFYDLMATRATRVAPRHVEALNRIDLEFNSDTVKDKEVLNRWRIYADHLSINLEGASEAAVTQWNDKGSDLFTELLVALTAALGYRLDRVEIRRGIYYPRAHGIAEARRDTFEREIVRLLTGESSLNMNVTGFPYSEPDVALNRKLQEALLNALSEEGALRTKAV